MPPRYAWTRDDLVRAVDGASTISDVCRALGLVPGAKAYVSVRHHLKKHGIDASGLVGGVPGDPRIRSSWTDDELRNAVAASTTLADVQRRLGYVPTGGIHRWIKGHIARLEIDTSHFVGQSWMAGRKKPQERMREELTKVLIKGSAYRSTGYLRKRLINAGLKPACCEECGLTEWRGRPLPLELDHINGDNTDNRLENLRILCPNCHSITDTWCNGAASRRTPTGSRGRT